MFYELLDPVLQYKGTEKSKLLPSSRINRKSHKYANQWNSYFSASSVLTSVSPLTHLHLKTTLVYAIDLQPRRVK